MLVSQNLRAFIARNLKYIHKLFFSAKDLENSIKAGTRLCKEAFINCSQTEDEALEYMVKCYTSQTQVEKNIEELLQIQHAASKLKTALEAVVSASEEANSNGTIVSCATYITEVEKVETLYLSSSLIGNGAEIVAQTTTIVQQSVTACTATQIIRCNQSIQLLTTVIVQITTVITQYQKILVTLTGSTPDTPQITTMTLPDDLGIVNTTTTATTTGTM